MICREDFVAWLQFQRSGDHIYTVRDVRHVGKTIRGGVKIVCEGLSGRLVILREFPAQKKDRLALEPRLPFSLSFHNLGRDSTEGTVV